MQGESLWPLLCIGGDSSAPLCASSLIAANRLYGHHPWVLHCSSFTPSCYQAVLLWLSFCGCPLVISLCYFLNQAVLVVALILSCHQYTFVLICVSCHQYTFVRISVSLRSSNNQTCWFSTL